MEKFLTILLFLLLPEMKICAQAKGDCLPEQQLQGWITDNTHSAYTLYLYQPGGNILDSVRTENGIFSFCLTAHSLPFYELRVAEIPHFNYFFIPDFSAINKIEIRSFHEKTVHLEGSHPAHRLALARNQVQQLYQQYVRERRKMLNHEEWTPIQQHYDSIFRQTFSSFFYPDPALGIAALYADFSKLEMITLSWNTAATLLNQLKQLPIDLSKSTAVHSLKGRLKMHIYAQKGAPAHDFMLPGLYGNFIDSRDFRGQYLLLDFWGSWCKPCIEKNELLREQYVNLQNRGLIILTIMMDFSQTPFTDEGLEAALENDPVYPWPHAVLFKSDDSADIINFYRAYMLPQTTLIDPYGQILAIGLKTPEDILQILSSSRR